MEYDIYVEKGGGNWSFLHHYIVLESPKLSMSKNRVILELTKILQEGITKVVPNVCESHDATNLTYNITVKTTQKLVLHGTFINSSTLYIPYFSGLVS